MSKLRNGEEFELEHSLVASAKFKINASIQRFNSRLFCAYRTDSLDDYDARNFLTELDENFSPLSHIPMIPENGNSAFEDVRLFIFRDNLMAIYTYLPKKDSNVWTFQYGLGIGIVDVKTGIISQQTSLRKYTKSLHSKNWIPYIFNDNLYLVTDFEPHVRVLEFKYGKDSFCFSEISLEVNKTGSWAYGQIRGGTPFIAGPNENSSWQYCFVHSHITLPNGNINTRFYVYTVLRFCPVTKNVEYHKIPIDFSKLVDNRNYEELWLSATRGTAMRVVFPMGLINFQDGVVMSYGKDDCVSRLVYYDWDFLIKLFDH
ncbi:hypothetical protein ACXZ1K_09625 [Pedobacter sp. PWIIR3]